MDTNMLIVVAMLLLTATSVFLSINAAIISSIKTKIDDIKMIVQSVPPDTFALNSTIFSQAVREFARDIFSNPVLYCLGSHTLHRTNKNGFCIWTSNGADFIRFYASFTKYSTEEVSIFNDELTLDDRLLLESIYQNFKKYSEGKPDDYFSLINVIKHISVNE